MLPIDNHIQIPLAEIQFSYVRSSGPGGQNVNKVASKAVLRWNPVESRPLPDTVLQRFRTQFPRCVTGEGEIIITSQRTRDALKNKADCLEKLRTMILHVLKEPKRRIPTKPTKGSIKRRLETKAKNSQKKQNRRIISGD
ncbi:aminoacyl-tRNA hydrolase [Planctomycetales bacterium]|nr:aminoacyl-tRNA hydrolase [Planctomycetales bacterium]